MKRILVLIFFALCVQQLSAQKNIKIWIVRHAEKDVSSKEDLDPELSAKGALRAEALKKELRSQKLDSIFTTDYKRTKLTAFPLADITGLNIKTYDAAQLKSFVETLKANASGKKILIVGHSNTVLETIEALGGKKPLDSLGERVYDILFIVTINGDKVEVKTKKYGDN